MTDRIYEEVENLALCTSAAYLEEYGRGSRQFNWNQMTPENLSQHYKKQTKEATPHVGGVDIGHAWSIWVDNKKAIAIALVKDHHDEKLNVIVVNRDENKAFLVRQNPDGFGDYALARKLDNDLESTALLGLFL